MADKDEKKGTTKQADAATALKEGAKDEPQATTVPSPTGPQPISTVAASEEEAAEIVKDRQKQLAAEEDHPRAGDFLSKEQIDKLDERDLALVARTRGYTDPNTRRVSRERFTAMQKDDEFVRPPKK